MHVSGRSGGFAVWLIMYKRNFGLRSNSVSPILMRLPWLGDDEIFMLRIGSRAGSKYSGASCEKKRNTEDVRNAMEKRVVLDR